MEETPARVTLERLGRQLQRDRRVIPEVQSSPVMEEQPKVEDEKMSWDFGYGEEEAEEEETGDKESVLSYEVFHPPPPEEADLGKIIKDTFGIWKRRPDAIAQPQAFAEDMIYRYTLCNANGFMIQIITLGATITAIKYPDNRNYINDVSIGFDTLEDYVSLEKNGISFGGTLGRFAGYIHNATIELEKREHFLSANLRGVHHERGGFEGFDRKVWKAHVAYDRVIMTYVSPHEEEGYPGDLMVQKSFHLTNDNQLIVVTTSNTSKPTIIGTAQNVYFNLAGHEKGPEGLKEHLLLVNADKYLKEDEKNNTPTGDIENVGATYFDLRVPRPVWKAMKRIPGGGYNHTFCLTKGYPRTSVCFAARLIHPQTGRYVELMTDLPGLYINTGTYLPNPNATQPLVASDRFNEEMYLRFCREERLKDEYVNDLQDRMGTKQTWPGPKDLEGLNDPDIMESLQYGREEEAEEDTEGGDEESEGEELDDEGMPAGLKFLKDEAETSEEEGGIPEWEPPKPIQGRKGALYEMNGAVCLRPQEYPDSMRHKEFPKPVIRPGDCYSRTTIYKFGIIPQKTERTSALYL